MSLTATDWIKLNRLLDEVLDLEPEKRCDWMESLPAEYESVRETLRSMLFRQSGVETLDVLRRAPLIAALPVERSADDLVGPYRLIRRIGEGGMSTVWLAERADGSLQRQVALKLPRVSLMDPDLGDRLVRERDILAALEHPGIARLYDAGVTGDGQPYLAIEYVDGVALDHYVRTHSLTLRQRIALFEQVARAVAYAHARLIVHRDLKPTNVLVDRSGDVRLLDFGIARLLEAEGVATSYSGVRAFTPRYAAPEQFAGESPTIATDVYSLGVILFELLSGHSPYKRSDHIAGRTEIICLAPMSILEVVGPNDQRALKGDLDAILRKALQADPLERYETIGDFMDDLQRHRRNLPVSARADTFAYRAGKFVTRYRLAVGLGSALIAVVATGAVVSLWQASIAVRERDRALRLFEQAEASNDFWTRLFTEGVGNDEAVTFTQLLARGESMAEGLWETSPLQYSLAADAIAATYISHGLYGKAEVVLERALERTSNLDVGNHRVQSLRCKYASAIAARGRVPEATKILDEVIAGAGSEPDLHVYCLHRRAIIARDNNDAPDALRYIQEARRIHDMAPTQDGTLKANIVSDLGYAYALNGRSLEAEREYEEAVAILRRSGRQQSNIAFTVFNNWGVLSISTGQPEEALRHFREAAEIARRFSPDGVPAPFLLGNRGTTLYSLARYEEAKRDLALMRERASVDGSARQVTYADAVTAEIAIAEGDLRRAEEVLRPYDPGTGYVADTTPGGLRILLVTAKLRMEQGKYEQSRALFTQVIDGFVRGRTVVGGLARAYAERANLGLVDGHLDEALQDATRAVEVARQTRAGDKPSNALGLAALAQGRAHQARGDDAAAAASLEIAVENLSRTVGVDHPDARSARDLLARSHRLPATS